MYSKENVLERLEKFQGLDKDKDRCPSNAWFTVRELIVIADYIKHLEDRCKKEGVEI